MYARSNNFLTHAEKKNRIASVLVSALQNLVQSFEFTKLKTKRKRFLLLFVTLTDN